MKVKEGFMMRKVGDQIVVVAMGQAAKQFHGMMNLNETGAFVWELLKQETSEENVLEAMMENYGIDRERAKKGLDSFLDKLRTVGVLEE